MFSGEYIWKYTHNAYDFSVLGATPITFPIEWHHSKIPGFAGRVSVPNFHGFSALMVFSSVAARFFTPQSAEPGLYPARWEHSVLTMTKNSTRLPTCNTSPGSKVHGWASTGVTIAGWWRARCRAMASVRPTIVQPIRTRRSACHQWTTEPLISRPDRGSGIPGRTLLRQCAATPTTPCLRRAWPRSSGPPWSKCQRPAAQNDDHNPPRIAPRHLFDLAVGDDNLFRGDKYKWNLRFSAINLTNNYALYNFLSTFSGTHYVTPRTYTAQLGFTF